MKEHTDVWQRYMERQRTEVGTMITLLLALALASPFGEVCQTCDCIELNHFCDEKGQPVYDQVVFWDWPYGIGENVKAWTMLEPNKLAKRPLQSPHNGRYHVRWLDTDAKMFRHLHSAQFKETWTQEDPERANKSVLHESLRRGLIKTAPAPSVNPVEEGE